MIPEMVNSALSPSRSAAILPAASAPAEHARVEVEKAPRQEGANPASTARLKEIVTQVAQVVRRDLEFDVDEASGRTVITVVDAASKEVVRQIPAEEMLELARRLDELVQQLEVSGEEAKGLLMTVQA